MTTLTRAQIIGRISYCERELIRSRNALTSGAPSMAAYHQRRIVALEAKLPALYALQAARCRRCWAPLSDPDSLARGLGPECAVKVAS